jgi:hypothetical protein
LDSYPLAGGHWFESFLRNIFEESQAKLSSFYSARWTHIRQPADSGFESFLRNTFEESQAELSFFILLVGLISASRRTLGANPFSAT